MAKEKWRAYKHPARFGNMYELRKGPGGGKEVNIARVVLFFLAFGALLAYIAIKFIA